MKWSDYFYYDETSTTFLRWKNNIYKGNPEFLAIAAGEIAGTRQYRENGDPKRLQVQLNNKVYAIHTIIWEIFNGPIPQGMLIDHLDRNPFNNDISNLVVKTQAENSRNKSMSRKNTSGITGVSLHKRPRVSASWRDLDGKNCIKYFTIKDCGSLEKAIEAASQFRKLKIMELNSKGAGYEYDHGT